MLGRLLLAVLLTGALTGLVACGGGDEGGARQLNFFIFNEPGGGPQDVAEQCSQQSDGRYTINFNYLPNDADQQREQLVRRLAAEDSSVDLIGMDIIWTGEFANAGWIAPVPQEIEGEVTENVFDSVLATARFEDRLYNVPIWSNTQLLWYRSDKVDEPPRTWGEMVDRATQENMRIQVQASRYEGLVVWTNAMILSAGTQIVNEGGEVVLEEEATKRALEAMGNLGRSAAAAANIDTSEEDTGRQGFESGNSIFMVNYPFVYPSAEGNAPEIFENMEAAQYPRVDPDRESNPPLGGINLAVSAYSDKQELAWEAIRCMIRPDNQLTITEAGGLPPVREDLYDREEIREAYPGFADVVRDSIANAGPRPSNSPAYQDLSLAIQRAIHPVTAISPSNAQETYDRLKSFVERAVEREGLL
jgi:multiple sugar transport system substrate-binding protein